MSAGIVIPYRPSLARRDGFARVVEHLKGTGLRSLATGAVTPWSPGRARNHGARVLAPWADPIVFNDADSLCPPSQILDAVRLAAETPGLVFAYDLYVRKTPAGRDGEIIHNSGSMACVAISRECFEQVGGFDESYVGWGYEDLDFGKRCAALWPSRRVSGPVYHLWHGERRADDSPADSDPGQVARNLERWTSVPASTV